MAKTICLVTYELAPINRGGAGVVISALAEALAKAGHRVHVLADMPAAEVEQYREQLKQRGVTGITAHALVTLVPRAPEAPTVFQAKSAHFRAGLYQLAKTTHFDLVEFFEYAGPAFETLTLRTPDDKLAGTEIAVRIHGSLGMIDQVEGAAHVATDRHTMYRMEEWSLRLADVVFAPLHGIGAQYHQIYGFDVDRMLVCPPPMDALLAPIGQPAPRRDNPDEVVFFGKLQAVKGCDLFVEAALLVAESRPHLRFVLIGPDVSDANGSMRARLDAIIPPQLKARFQFVPHIQRERLGSVTAGALCAVVPSRAESFCLAAHELHRVGVPLVLSDIPPFRDVFVNGENCLKCDGTAAQLAVQIERLALDQNLVKRLARSGQTMKYTDVASVYAQAGLGRNELPDAVTFARREVGSLGFWAAEHDLRHRRLSELLAGGSKTSTRLGGAMRQLRSKVQQPAQKLMHRLRLKTTD